MWSIKAERNEIEGGDKMNVYGKSDIGLVRETNQDDIKFEKISDDVLWAVVCDGMGGYNGGDIASEVVSSKISDRLKNINKTNTHEIIKSVIESAINEAGEAVYDMSLKDKNLEGMGTTAVVALVNKGVLHVAHVGDSRAYLMDNSKIKQITVDHSIVQDMLLKGDITEEEATYHPQKNIITRALGVKKGVFPDYNSYTINPGDSILLCTDGLTNELKDKKIYEICKYNIPEDVPEKLIDEAKKCGGADNITVALII